MLAQDAPYHGQKMSKQHKYKGNAAAAERDLQQVHMQTMHRIQMQEQCIASGTQAALDTQDGIAF